MKWEIEESVNLFLLVLRNLESCYWGHEIVSGWEPHLGYTQLYVQFVYI